MQKRMCAMLLMLLMIVGMLPSMALAADPAPINQNIKAQWPNFRGNDNNMAIVDAKTPTDAVYAELKWEKKLGSGWNAAPSVQIIVDDSIVVMCGNKTVNKLNMQTGEIKATAEMSAAPNWGYTPPTYGEKLIFCPLAGGIIEAYKAETLENVWTYQSTAEKANGWQALSTITYSNGYIYTGFWNGETGEADFVCINAKDGAEEWKHTVKGGFYWAGSIIIGDFIVVGTDDGATGSTGNSNLLVFKKHYTAQDAVEPIASAELTGCGDQRSSIAYEDGKIYFTTKGGYLCSAAINSQTGAITDLKTVSFGKQSTSTPLVYQDYIYFGTGQGFGQGWFNIAKKKIHSML